MVVSIFFYFHHYLGKLSHLTNIFQMGWNHQPDKFFRIAGKKHLTQHSEGFPSPTPGDLPKGESRDESQVGEPSGGNAHGFGGDGWEKIWNIEVVGIVILLQCLF